MARRAELVVEAATVECAQYAYAYGADAVCLHEAATASDRELAAQTRLAHDWGKRLYLVFDAARHTASGLPGALHRAQSAGVDALVLDDIGVLKLARDYVPELPVHYHLTGSGASNATVYALQAQGVARVRLAQELALDEVTDLRMNTTRALELELLVLGELSVQLPRWHLLDGQPEPEAGGPKRHLFRKKTVGERPEQRFEVEDGPRGSILSGNETLCALGFLDLLLEAGAGSLRVGAYHGPEACGLTASATLASRQALDTALAAPRGTYALPAFAAAELVRIQRKPWTAGFFFGGPSFQKPARLPAEQWRPFAVVESQADGLLYCGLCGPYTLGLPTEALTPPGLAADSPAPYGQAIAYNPPGLWQADGSPARQVALEGQRCILSAPPGQELPPGTVLRVLEKVR